MTEADVITLFTTAAAVVIALGVELIVVYLAYSYGAAKGKLSKAEEIDERRDGRMTWIEQRLEGVEEDLDEIEAAVRGGGDDD